MAEDDHNPEPAIKIAALRDAGHRVLVLGRLGVADPRPGTLLAVARGLAGRRRAPGGEAREPDALQPVVVPPRHTRATDRLNDALVRRRLAPRVAALPGRPVLWFRFATPELVRQIGRLGERLVVYERVDDHRAFDYRPRAARALAAAEDALLARADLTIVISEPLRAQVEGRARRLVLVPQGGDVARFGAPAALPADLAAIPRPRLGVAGPIDARVDAGLIAEVARAHPGAGVCVVGPVTVPALAAPLRALPNVHLLGARDHALMPGYVQGFDVGLMPYARHGVTAVGFPMKSVEYLAAGIPSVAIALPALAPLAGVVTLAADRAAFVAAVGEALAGRAAGDPAARRAAAAPYAWPARTAELRAALADALERAA